MALKSSSSSSSSSAPKTNNRYILSTVFLLPFVLLGLLFFSRTSLEPKLSLYTDVLSQTPSVSPSRSAETDTLTIPLPDTKTPILSKFDLGDSTLHEVTKSEDTKVLEGFNDKPIASKSKENKDVEDFRATPSLRKSDLDDISSESNDTEDLKGSLETPILSKSEFDDNVGEKNSTPGITTNQVVGSVLSTRNEEKLVDNAVKREEQVVTDNGKGFGRGQSCDFYKGSWVKDENHPIYKPKSCPYVDEAFDCQSNGRPDSDYLNWRWKPDGCDLPRFSAADFLERLRGKKLMLVGDSMNRNQFESLLCILREGLINKSRMYEIHGYKITKGRGYYVFKFEDYNCTVEFVRSHFLVREGVRINAQGSSNPTLSIDRIDKTCNRWKRADILIFNTGHWWTHGKTARGKNYYKEGDQIYPKFDAVEAYRRSLKTWAKWIDENMSRDKLIIYRGYSSAHYRGGDWDSGGSCNKETDPVLTGSILNNYPLKMKIVEEVIKDMQLPVVLLNVTQLTNFRKDGHPSVYGRVTSDGKKVSTRKQDCSHWCLPGVPDAWNELIYATLVSQPAFSVNNQ